MCNSIRDATGDEVGTLKGWVGVYGPTDLLSRLYRLARSGRRKEAYRIFQGVPLQIVFGLQGMESITPRSVC